MSLRLITACAIVAAGSAYFVPRYMAEPDIRVWQRQSMGGVQFKVECNKRELKAVNRESKYNEYLSPFKHAENLQDYYVIEPLRMVVNQACGKNFMEDLAYKFVIPSPI